MTARPEHINSLIKGVDRYNPSNCHLLDSYLLQQLQTTSYDLLANLAQLKLYQFNPELSSTSSTLEILFKALVHEPFGPDFALGWSLVGDSFVVGAALPPKELGSDDDEETDEPRAPAAPDGEREIAARLQHLSALLHGRKFRLFWSALREGVATEDPTVEKKVREGISALEVSAVGFEKVLRENIALEIEASFKGLQLSALEIFLGLAPNSAQLAPLVAAHGWTLEGSIMKLRENESNTPKAVLQREHIEIEQLSRLLARSQAA